MRLDGPQQPQFSIYNTSLTPGRERVKHIASAKIRESYRLVMDILEDGWEIIRPLILAAEAYWWGRVPSWREATAVASVIVADINDEFRGMVFECWESIPAPGGFLRHPVIGNVADQAMEISRYLHLLKLAAPDPTFPADLRELIVPTCEAFDRWMEGLQPIIQPIALLENAYVFDGAAPPKVHSKIRVV